MEKYGLVLKIMEMLSIWFRVNNIHETVAIYLFMSMHSCKNNSGSYGWLTTYKLLETSAIYLFMSMLMLSCENNRSPYDYYCICKGNKLSTLLLKHTIFSVTNIRKYFYYH